MTWLTARRPPRRRHDAVLTFGGDARVTRVRPQDYLEAAGEMVAGTAEEGMTQ